MKVAIAGFGLEGQSNYRYFTQQGHDIVIADERPTIDNLPDGVPTILGPGAFDRLEGFDMVVRSAGVSPYKIKTDGKVWSTTNEFFAQCPAPIIGVTGTKGKGTTSSLIASILRAAGKNVHLLGNIGTPALDVLTNISADDIIVYEISSFQLWDVVKSPQTAVVLMVEPDHLNIHTDMKDYVEAKSRIGMFQTAEDTTIFHPTNTYSAQIASVSKGKKVRYMVADDGGAYVRDDKFYVGDSAIASVDSLQIAGQHNIENACAAISASWIYTQDTVAITKGLSEFTGLPHRLKFVKDVDGVMYYDDNYSSAPSATLAAMRSFDQPEILIVGGYDKKVDFAELAQAVANRHNIKIVLLIGQTRHLLASAFDAVGFDKYELCDESELSPIVTKAHKHASPGDVVIMSPGCASFDMFDNFTDRGNQFIELVQGL